MLCTAVLMVNKCICVHDWTLWKHEHDLYTTLSRIDTCTFVCWFQSAMELIIHVCHWKMSHPIAFKPANKKMRGNTYLLFTVDCFQALALTACVLNSSKLQVASACALTQYQPGYRRVWDSWSKWISWLDCAQWQVGASEITVELLEQRSIYMHVVSPKLGGSTFQLDHKKHGTGSFNLAWLTCVKNSGDELVARCSIIVEFDHDFFLTYAISGPRTLRWLLLCSWIYHWM